MFGIDGQEFLVILLIFIVVVGPRDLPKLLKTIAKAMAYVHSTANEFRHQLDNAIRQAELDDLRKTLPDISDLNPSKELTEVLNPIHDAVRDIRDNFCGNAPHYKSENDKKILGCNKNRANENFTVSFDLHNSRSISVTPKDKEDVS
ncbi:Sec-independent protein translocase protein TatB [Bartonella sp. CB169]|uniref:Sec-independent protein translocase protein TatB n=1 Tax=Bartonella sp. CB169 TaxID=3112257 RepID=UPI00300E1DD3